jgi:hypothetical protein
MASLHGPNRSRALQCVINNEWEFQEGDRVYLAPEALTLSTLDKSDQTTKMDVFSLGTCARACEPVSAHLRCACVPLRICGACVCVRVSVVCECACVRVM